MASIMKFVTENEEDILDFVDGVEIPGCRVNTYRIFLVLLAIPLTVPFSTFPSFFASQGYVLESKITASFVGLQNNIAAKGSSQQRGTRY